MHQRPPNAIPPWKKALFGLLVTVVFFALLEAVLALVGVQPLSDREDPFAGFSGRIPHFTEESTDAGEVVVRVSPTKRKHFHDLAFSARKKPGTQRVVCLGGSTTYGRPFWDDTSFPGWLRELLRAEAEGDAWEVINAGGISYASYRNVGVMRELAAYDPDLFVVYTGHNEFLEYRTYEDLIEASGVVQESAAIVSRTRIAGLVRRLVGTGSSGHSASELPSLRSVNAVGPEAYSRSDELAVQIVAHFRSALEEMVQIAQAAGARILFVVPASNLADFTPFKSELSKGVSDWSREQLEAQLALASRARREGRFRPALQALERAEAIDGRYAAMHFEKARVLRALGRHEEAAAHFRRAKDEDAVPLRAVSALGDAIREVGAREEVGLLDFETLAATEATGGVPGDDLFADHVHPHIEANGLLANAVATWILGHAPSAQGRSEAEARVRTRIDGPRYAAELLKLSRLMETVSHPEVARRCAERALELDPQSVAALLRLAALELDEGRLETAERHAAQALTLRPDSAVAMAIRGGVLAARGERDDALRWYLMSIAADGNMLVARERAAVLLSQMGRVADAVEHFEAVARLTPKSAQAHSNLGLAYANVGRVDDAEAHFKRSIGLDGDFGPARYNYGLLLVGLGRAEPARRQFEEVLRIAPGHEGAREQLAKMR